MTDIPDPAGGVRPAHRVGLTGGERAALREQLRVDYDDGATVRDLAAASGWSYGCVHRLLAEAGTHPRPRRRGHQTPAATGSPPR